MTPVARSLFLGLLAFLVMSAPLHSQTGERVNSIDSGESRWATQARQIDDYLAGRLDIAVDPASLFVFSVDGENALPSLLALRFARDASLYETARRGQSIDALSKDQLGLALAQARYLRLTDKQKDALAARHAERRARAAEVKGASAAKADLLQQLDADRQALDDFLDGRSKGGARPLDLSRLVGSLANETRDSASDPGARPAETAPIDERLAWARRAFGASVRRLMMLTPQALQALERAAGAAGSPSTLDQAQTALRQANQQLEQARQANPARTNRPDQRLDGERARLIATAAAQTRLRARIEQMRSTPAKVADILAEWRRRSASLSGGSADQAYAELVEALKSIRRALRTSLDEPSALPPDSQIYPPAIDSALDPGLTETKALIQERGALSRQSQLLTAQYAAALWAEREALQETMAALNGKRLGFIGALSPEKRNAVLGFGSDGFAQARREVSQIVLDVRYHLQGWRMLAARAQALIMRPTPESVLAMLQLLVWALAFRWWRGAGDLVLKRGQLIAQARRPRTVLSAAQATMLARFREVRRPIEWLIFALVSRWLLPPQMAFAGIDLLWTILLWSLCAISLVRIADMLASSGSEEDPRAKLRWSSLRLVASVLVGVGLVLNLTSASVGRGTIYHWVLTLCWLLAPAVALILAHWWRDRIASLAASASGSSSLLGWIAKDPGGLSGLLGRVLAGAVLLWAGARTIISRRLRALAVVREIYEQRSRASAARKVAQDMASGRYAPLPPHVYAALEPHRLPERSTTHDKRPGEFVMPAPSPGQVLALIGERGLGKSAMLRDIGEDCGDRTISVRVDGRGFEGLLDDLARDLCPKARRPREAALLRALASTSAGTLIAVDDVQRLVTPAIGGLDDLDRLIALARTDGTQASWIFSIGAHAWTYIARARADRSLFDLVARLPRWPVDDLRALIERRTQQAGIEPDFSGIVDDGAFQFDTEVSQDERRRRAFYERLTDYAQGNPAVALEYWRRSLFVDAVTGVASVRTFATPDLSSLASLPAPAFFVLRAVLQKDLATDEDILRSTDLPADMVSDAVRALTRLGTLLQDGQCYRIKLAWWPEVVRLLERQNLLVRWTT